MNIDESEDFHKLATALQSFSDLHRDQMALQRAQMKRLLPLQIAIGLLQLCFLPAMVWMMVQVKTIAADQKRSAVATEELTERPTIELVAVSSSSAVIVVPPASASGKPIELVLPPK